MKNLEENKLILAFMGLEPIEIFGRYSMSKDHCSSNHDTAQKTLDGFASMTKYNTSWEWLVPVIAKLKGILFEDFDNNKHTIHGIEGALWDGKVETAFNYVVSAIYELKEIN